MANYDNTNTALQCTCVLHLTCGFPGNLPVCVECKPRRVHTRTQEGTHIRSSSLAVRRGQSAAIGTRHLEVGDRKGGGSCGINFSDYISASQFERPKH